MVDTADTETGPIRFTLDGRPLVTEERRLLAGAVLRLGGLDPAGYDLAEVRRGQADPKRYEDDEHVRIKSGNSFVSIRQRAEVA